MYMLLFKGVSVQYVFVTAGKKREKKTFWSFILKNGSLVQTITETVEFCCSGKGKQLFCFLRGVRTLADCCVMMIYGRSELVLTTCCVTTSEIECVYTCSEQLHSKAKWKANCHREGTFKYRDNAAYYNTDGSGTTRAWVTGVTWLNWWASILFWLHATAQCCNAKMFGWN